MNQFITTIKTDLTIQLVLGAAFLLLIMTTYVAFKNLKKKRAQKREINAKKEWLTTEAKKLLSVTEESPLDARKQLQVSLNTFRDDSTKRGMDPDMFISLELQNSMRQLSRAAKDELSLSNENVASVPDASFPELFEPQDEPTGRFDRSQIEDDCPTTQMDRRSMAPTGSTNAMNAQFDHLMSYEEDPQGVITLVNPEKEITYIH